MIPDFSIASLLKAYRSGEITPRERVHDVWTRAQKSDSAIWISRPKWEFLELLLKKLEGKTPDELPLYGIPFAIKDNIDWAGQATTCACPAFSYVPGESAFVVQELINAGAIPIGKTNLDQFATGLVGVRSPYSWPANAFDAEYVPGGSSSGSAVAVALGLASFALGTDTAGSGRIPASLNNLVGLKPTRGLLSNRGLVPACKTLDCISIFALTAADALEVLNVVGKYDPTDAYARKETSQPQKPLTENVIGIPKRGQLEFFGNASAAQLFDEAVTRLQSMGFKTREVDLQPFLDAARLLYEGPWVAERFAGIETLMKENPEALHPVTRQIISGGDKASAVDGFRAQYKLAELKRASEAAWENVDVILTPTAGTHYKVEEVLAEPIKLNSNLGYYTNYMNLLDLAAWAVPTGFLDTGMPWGVTFFAPAFTDRFLGSLAAKYHAACALPIGKTSLQSEDVLLPKAQTSSGMKIAVCGAHMEGLALHHQLTSRGAKFVSKTKSAPTYRFYHLPPLKPGLPARPGMVKVPEGGAAIELEVWEIPQNTVATFLEGIAAPLGLGRVELEDGTSVCGFICEGFVSTFAEDITHFGGWRAWLNREE